MEPATTAPRTHSIDAATDFHVDMLPPIRARSITQLLIELQQEKVSFRSVLIAARLLYQIATEGRLLELLYFAFNRATPESLKHSNQPTTPLRTRPVVHGYRWASGPWKETFHKRLLHHDHPIAEFDHFFPTQRGSVLQFGASGVIELSSLGDEVRRDTLLRTPFHVLRHSVCELPNGVIVAGEYGQYAKRLIFIDPSGTVHCRSPYAAMPGVRHFHLVTNWNDRLVIATGDARKRLDYLFVEFDSSGRPTEFRIHPVITRLGGFTAAASIKNTLYLGTDFFGQENYILKITDRTINRRIFLPKSIRHLIVDRIELFGPQRQYFAMICRNMDSRSQHALIIFDPEHDLFLTAPFFLKNNRFEVPMHSRGNDFVFLYDNHMRRIELL